MPYTAAGNYVSPWMLRSQENLRNPNPLSLNKPVIKKTNNNGRVAFSPMKVSPKLRKTRKVRKARKSGTRRR